MKHGRYQSNYDGQRTVKVAAKRGTEWSNSKP
ncbi:hypothetical protein OKW24_001413 [Peribacillus simplex]|nr:hypothetical protein [Peribacillus simplex]